MVVSWKAMFVSSVVVGVAPAAGARAGVKRGAMDQ